MPSPYNVSTITAVGNIGGAIDIYRVFNALKISPPFPPTSNDVSTCIKPQTSTNVDFVCVRGEIFDEGMYRVRLADADGQVQKFASKEHIRSKWWMAASGSSRAREMTRRNELSSSQNREQGGRDQGASKKRLYFNNQVTVVLQCPIRKNLINVKVFHNGGIQMTGVKTIEQGQQAQQNVVNMIRGMIEEGYEIADKTLLRCQSFRVCLINSDHRLGFEIRRDKFMDILASQYPHLRCNFEPCKYPGVVIHFPCQPDNDNEELTKGCCKGGPGPGSKIVTIIIFRSGCVIITGAKTYEQLEAAYTTLNNIVYTHRSEIERIPLNEEQEQSSLPAKNKNENGKEVEKVDIEETGTEDELKQIEKMMAMQLALAPSRKNTVQKQGRRTSRTRFRNVRRHADEPGIKEKQRGTGARGGKGVHQSTRRNGKHDDAPNIPAKNLLSRFCFIQQPI